jgi:hypothetical protein
MIALTSEQTCQEIQRQFDQWRGCLARLWEFSPSLDALILRLTSEDRPGNLHVICSPCIRLKTPVHWASCNLQVQCGQDEDGSRIFLIRDETAQVEVACRQVVLAENVEPVY